MEDFNYCIWFLPEKNHEWYSYTNAFNPHMTIKSRLEKESLQDYNKIINSQKKMIVRLKGKLYQTEINHFYALQYDIEPINKEDIPVWWPEDAHISFKYKYHLPYTTKEIQEIGNSIQIREALMDSIEVYKCTGDFSTWPKITISDL